MLQALYRSAGSMERNNECDVVALERSQDMLVGNADGHKLDIALRAVLPDEIHGGFRVDAGHRREGRPTLNR